MTDVIPFDGASPIIKVGFWCPAHGKYDTCLLEVSCRQHPVPGRVMLHNTCTCDEKAWKKDQPAEPTCSCPCHKTHFVSDFSLCRYCCQQYRERSNIGDCECLCHTEYFVGHTDYCYCCSDWRRVGESDRLPFWGFDLPNNHPWTAPLKTRVLARSSIMTENIHLLMSINGGPLAVDMFHVIMHAIDSNYPIAPMRKAGDQIKTCIRCKGIVWERCVIGPHEIRLIAGQAAKAVNQPLVVRVHHWQIAKNCGCYEYRDMEVDKFNPSFKGHQPQNGSEPVDFTEKDGKLVTIVAGESE